MASGTKNSEKARNARFPGRNPDAKDRHRGAEKKMGWHRLDALVIGIFVGFLGGLFGKGGSAVATPLLSLAGYPGFVAVVAPLPATIPGTLIAAAQYWKLNLMDWEIFWWSIAIGGPTTILGAYLSKYTGAGPLLFITGVLVLGFGLSFLWPRRHKATLGEAENRPSNGDEKPPHWKARLGVVAGAIGIISGLLANSGGFLYAPSYAKFLRQRIKKAFACSLAVSAVLAVPGTAMHAYLGHVDWGVAGMIALGSVPASWAGARLAIRTQAEKLEFLYGAALTVLGAFFLYHSRW
jgi:uncharacterized protein